MVSDVGDTHAQRNKDRIIILGVVALVVIGMIAMKWIEGESALNRLDQERARCHALIQEANVQLAKCQSCLGPPIAKNQLDFNLSQINFSRE